VRCIYNAIRAGPIRTPPDPIAEVCSRFLLTVGSVGTRKNQLRCIEAFARSGLARSGVSYIMCGPPDPGFDEIQAAAKQTPGVILLPYVTDAQLSWLYRSASGLVLVSLLEGFGMPVAEAIACGLVPLVTRNSVLEEVAGDGALVADAQGADEIARAMVSLANMRPIEREERAARLRAAITRFDIATIRDQWRAAFRDFLASASQ
jgi:glycosyltransferase involved in cell wall biosynthesis